MSTPNGIEEYANKDEDRTNVSLRKLETLKSIIDCIESAENAYASIPGKHSSDMTELLSIKNKVSQMMKDVDASKVETFVSKYDAVIQQKLDKVVGIINNDLVNIKEKNKFCDNKLVRSFLKYLLVDNPAAFFHTVNVDAEGFKAETAEEKK
jgi:hypothetical protein